MMPSTMSSEDVWLCTYGPAASANELGTVAAARSTPRATTVGEAPGSVVTNTRRTAVSAPGRPATAAGCTIDSPMNSPRS